MSGTPATDDEPVPRIPIMQVINPELREEATRSLPSRHERRENLNNLKVQCDAQCGKILQRNELKACARCKQARYCSQACQKAHWRAGHKIECGEGTVNDLLLKLAERALAVPKIVEHFWMISIVLFDLLQDKSTADKFAMKIECDKEAADLMAAMRRMMSGEDKDENAQIALHYDKFTKVPLEEAPARTQKAAENAREKFKKDRKDGEGSPAQADSPVITCYFVTEQDGTGKDGLVSAAWVLPEWTLAYMKSNPKSVIRSAVFGDTEVPVDMSSLRDGLNSVIRMDKANKLKLRGYPSKERPAPQPVPEEDQPVVIYAGEH